MTNINGIPKMVVGSKDYELIQQMMGNRDGSKVVNEETLFKTMQYYEMTNSSDNWSSDAQALSVEELIKMWQDFDDEETSFAQDFDTFDAFLTTYKKPVEPPVEPPVDDGELVRPYTPKTDMTDAEKERMNDFDLMRANDIHGKLCQDGDYELLLEYIRQREGSSLLYEGQYDSTGALTESGKAREAEMIATLKQLDSSENTLGTVMEEFLKAYGIEEPKGDSVNNLADSKAVINYMLAGTNKEISIGENKYLITNNGLDGNEFSYEVKTNENGEKYISMVGSDWRIQDISGKQQADYIQIVGSRNVLDMAMGDDIAYMVGEENQALMGTGDDKVYIEGDGNFADLWRGDDQLFNISGNNTTGVGFTGNDNFYVKGENVVLSGESNTGVGDGLYADGIVAGFDIENELEKPIWFPDKDLDIEKNEMTMDGTFIFDGIKYKVYKKYGTEASDKITYYKDENNRTIFESNGWNITVLDVMNTTGDKDYANVVIQGVGNTYFGSQGDDIIEVRGDRNNIHGDISDVGGGDDKIFITEGVDNIVYGEDGYDEVNTTISGNIFNEAIKDVERLNKSSLEVVIDEHSGWQNIDKPTAADVFKMNLVSETFGLPADIDFENLKQKDNLLSMQTGRYTYVADVYDDTGKVKEIVQKTDMGEHSKVEFVYSGESMQSTIITDYDEDYVSLVNPQGYRLTTIYDDVSSEDRLPQYIMSTDDNGDAMFTKEYNYNQNRLWTKYADGSYSIAKYSDLRKGISTLEKTDYYSPEGTLLKTEEVEKENTENDVVDENLEEIKEYLIDQYNKANDVKLKEKIKAMAKELGFDIE